MLQQYGPSVPLENLRRLSTAFGELRQLALNNQLTYPYSIRELVNIVKHLEVRSSIISPRISLSFLILEISSRTT